MEFFEYIRIPQYFIQIVRQMAYGSGAGGISLEELYILFAVAGGAYLFCVILGGLSLYVMAERAGLKHSWLGFVPFANTYYAGKVAGETPFFGRKMKRAGLYAMLAEIVYSVLEICSLIAGVLLANPAYYETSYMENSATLIFDITRVPAGLKWMVAGSTWFSIVSLVANLVMLVLLCAVYNGVFRKYSPKNTFALTVVSVLLPIRAFVLFAIRNNTPIDFDEYMKARLEQAMRSAGIGMDEVDVGTASPFEEFSERPTASPFAEFDEPYSNDPPLGQDDNHSDDPFGQ